VDVEYAELVRLELRGEASVETIAFLNGDPSRWLAELQRQYLESESKLDRLRAAYDAEMAKYAKLKRGRRLMGKATNVYADRRKPIVSLMNLLMVRIDSIERIVYLKSADPSERAQVVDFLLQGIQEHRKVKTGAGDDVDAKLWALIDGRWMFEGEL